MSIKPTNLSNLNVNLAVNTQVKGIVQFRLSQLIVSHSLGCHYWTLVNDANFMEKIGNISVAVSLNLECLQPVTCGIDLPIVENHDLC